jgi:hypothetical protein
MIRSRLKIIKKFKSNKVFRYNILSKMELVEIYSNPLRLTCCSIQI